jgi:hypothetical protein
MTASKKTPEQKALDKREKLDISRGSELSGYTLMFNEVIAVAKYKTVTTEEVMKLAREHNAVDELILYNCANCNVETRGLGVRFTIENIPDTTKFRYKVDDNFNQNPTLEAVIAALNMVEIEKAMKQLKQGDAYWGVKP